MPVNNLHYFCCRKYSPSTESAVRWGGGGGGGDYPGQEMVSIYLTKIKITTKFFNFIAKNTLTISWPLLNAAFMEGGQYQNMKTQYTTLHSNHTQHNPTGIQTQNSPPRWGSGTVKHCKTTQPCCCCCCRKEGIITETHYLAYNLNIMRSLHWNLHAYNNINFQHTPHTIQIP